MTALFLLSTLLTMNFLTITVVSVGPAVSVVQQQGPTILTTLPHTSQPYSIVDINSKARKIHGQRHLPPIERREEKENGALLLSEDEQDSSHLSSATNFDEISSIEGNWHSEIEDESDDDDHLEDVLEVLGEVEELQVQHQPLEELQVQHQPLEELQVQQPTLADLEKLKVLQKHSIIDNEKQVLGCRYAPQDCLHRLRRIQLRDGGNQYLTETSMKEVMEKSAFFQLSAPFSSAIPSISPPPLPPPQSSSLSSSSVYTTFRKSPLRNSYSAADHEKQQEKVKNLPIQPLSGHHGGPVYRQLPLDPDSDIWKAIAKHSLMFQSVSKSSELFYASATEGKMAFKVSERGKLKLLKDPGLWTAFNHRSRALLYQKKGLGHHTNNDFMTHFAQYCSLLISHSVAKIKGSCKRFSFLEDTLISVRNSLNFRSRLVSHDHDFQDFQDLKDFALSLIDSGEDGVRFDENDDGASFVNVDEESVNAFLWQIAQPILKQSFRWVLDEAVDDGNESLSSEPSDDNSSFLSLFIEELNDMIRKQLDFAENVFHDHLQVEQREVLEEPLRGNSSSSLVQDRVKYLAGLLKERARKEVEDELVRIESLKLMVLYLEYQVWLLDQKGRVNSFRKMRFHLDHVHRLMFPHKDTVDNGLQLFLNELPYNYVFKEMARDVLDIPELEVLVPNLFLARAPASNQPRENRLASHLSRVIGGKRFSGKYDKEKRRYVGGIADEFREIVKAAHGIMFNEGQDQIFRICSQFYGSFGVKAEEYVDLSQTTSPIAIKTMIIASLEAKLRDRVIEHEFYLDDSFDSSISPSVN